MKFNLNTVSTAERCSYKQLALIERLCDEQNIKLPASGYHLQKCISKSEASNIIDGLIKHAVTDIIID